MKTLRQFTLLAVLLALACFQAVAADLITAQSVSGITNTAATINWTTCAAANSQVFYGLNSAYGSQSTLNASLVTSHSVSLSGLTMATTYHFQVVSIDSSGNQLIGIDGTFSTTGSSGPTITTQPVDATVCNGASVTLTSAATGNPAPNVQWKQSIDGGSTYQNISGGAPLYYGDGCSGSLSNSGCKVEQFAYPLNTYRFADIFTTGSNAAGYAVAGCGVYLSALDPTNPQIDCAIYDNNTTGSLVPGCSAPEVTPVASGWNEDANFTACNLAANTSYKVVVQAKSAGTAMRFNNSNGGVATNTRYAQVVPYGTWPSHTWLPSPGLVSLYAKLLPIGSGGAANQPTYSFTALAAQNGYKYEAVWTSSNGSVTSTPATLTVNTLPVVTAQPLSTSVTSGNTATFTAAGSGSPSPTVQWQVSTNSGSTWANVGGATSTTLNVTGTVVGQNGNLYRAVFTNSCGSVNSLPVTLTVTPGATYNLSFSTSSARSSGAFLQGATLSGTEYLFTSLANSATTFNVSGLTKVCYWLDDVLMAGSGMGCDFLVPFDFNSSSTIPTFVQGASGPPTLQASNSSVAVAFPGAQSIGNLNVVAIGQASPFSTISSVTDTRGNTYTLIGTNSNGTARQSFYYAKNIGAGANTITVAFSSTATFPDVRIAEYSGLDTTAPADQGSANIGNGTAANSGPITTSAASEMLIAAGTTGNAFTAPGSGFTSRGINAFGNILEDEKVTSVGTYTATATAATGIWILHVMSFKASSGVSGWDTTKVTNGTHTVTQVVTPVSGSPEVDSATFTVNNSVGHSAVSSWVKGTSSNPLTTSVYRAPGACGGTFSPTRIASGLGGASYTDTTVVSGQSYCYAVQSVDTVTAQTSGYSNLVTAVIP